MCSLQKLQQFPHFPSTSSHFYKGSQPTFPLGRPLSFPRREADSPSMLINTTPSVEGQTSVPFLSPVSVCCPLKFNKQTVHFRVPETSLCCKSGLIITPNTLFPVHQPSRWPSMLSFVVSVNRGRS